MTEKERYWYYRSQGICVRCKKQKAVEGRCHCAECAEIQKQKQAETRDYYRKHGYCMCGNKLMGDEKRCPECLAKAYIANKKWKEKNLEENRKQIKKAQAIHQEKLKEKGLCRRCGKRPRAIGKTHCQVCLDKLSFKARAKWAREHDSRYERYANGLCYRCGKPLDTDKKLCKECCEKSILNIKGRPDNTNHPWRKENKLIKRAT